MGFNSAFKGLTYLTFISYRRYLSDLLASVNRKQINKHSTCQENVIVMWIYIECLNTKLKTPCP
jgi:hypothetical protein